MEFCTRGYLSTRNSNMIFFLSISMPKSSKSTVSWFLWRYATHFKPLLSMKMYDPASCNSWIPNHYIFYFIRSLFLTFVSKTIDLLRRFYSKSAVPCDVTPRCVSHRAGASRSLPSGQPRLVTTGEGMTSPRVLIRYKLSMHALLLNIVADKTHNVSNLLVSKYYRTLNDTFSSVLRA